MKTKEEMLEDIGYSAYIDMEYGNDSETIDYDQLAKILMSLTNKIEELETSLENLRKQCSPAIMNNLRIG